MKNNNPDNQNTRITNELYNKKLSKSSLTIIIKKEKEHCNELKTKRNNMIYLLQLIFIWISIIVLTIDGINYLILKVLLMPQLDGMAITFLLIMMKFVHEEDQQKQ